MSTITKSGVDTSVKVERIAKTLAHPLRNAILTAVYGLDRNESGAIASPSQLAELLGEPLGNISYHVRMLADRRMLKLKRRKPRRGAVEHYYEITPAGRAAVRLLQQLAKED